ncbi:pathogenesis-related leaf protein 6-like [Arachis ipaensis]|uniref:pathogenesis-related leaf protein 6-like n=1 Tax=Arachis ipaensis TaxID=130454 RepID=UPI0007AEFF24|nr:pathogenesis-related leaf protein 6-like [Arachis ipaensis]
MKRLLNILALFVSFASIIPLCCSIERLSSPEFYLKYHNAIREHVGSPALKWDREIEKHARNFVNAHSVDCLAKKPSISSGIGWNIARSWGNYTFVGGEALVQWALQHENYDHVTNSCVGGECHAFTQLVWKQSTRLGCARVTCHNHSGTLVRCNYEPPGNIPGYAFGMSGFRTWY